MARPIARRRLPIAFAIIGAAVLAGLAGPALAALAMPYPVPSIGERGTDVATVQQLIRAGRTASVGGAPTPTGRGAIVVGRYPAVPLDGVFGTTTDSAVQIFQGLRGLPPTGIVDAATWARLILPIGPGSTGDAVVALQRQLVEKRSAALALDGVYGPSTTAAVKTFQAHMGLAQTGAMNAATWQALIWHFELPRFSSAALCDASTGNGPANWGTAAMIATLETAGAAMVAAGEGRVVVNDVSFEHGGDIPGHITHEIGMDADIRPMRKANDQCSVGTRWTLSSYDRAATRQLVLALRAAAPGHIKVIFFSDPILIREGLTTYHSAHDDHLHVRICEAWNADPRYRC
jgi:peptidoglycan hydrolase-like protein with peptidoglycan-binding domain